MIDTSIDICGVKMKNPVTVASGTFGSGMEYSDFVDIGRLGAVTTKGVAITPWEGNPTLRDFDTKVIVNVCGHSTEEYESCVERLSDNPDVDLMEINVSCPNVKEGGIAFGVDPKCLNEITKTLKKKAKNKPIIMKLSPNVTDIAEMARAAVDGGADALSLINTLTGMKIDIYRRTYALANRTGGMSGPAVKPIAVRMVNQVASAVTVPIIGMGGICTAEDAIEFIMAGATAVSVGTANFNNPHATVEVIEGIEEFMKNQGIKSLDEIRGCVRW